MKAVLPVPNCPSLQPEGVHVAVVCTDVNHAIRDRGRGRQAANFGGPESVAGGCLHSCSPQINHAISHRWGRTEQDVIAVSAGDLQWGAGAGVQGVYITEFRDDIHYPIAYRRGGSDVFISSDIGCP